MNLDEQMAEILKKKLEIDKLSYENNIDKQRKIELLNKIEEENAKHFQQYEFSNQFYFWYTVIALAIITLFTIIGFLVI